MNIYREAITLLLFCPTAFGMDMPATPPQLTVSVPAQDDIADNQNPPTIDKFYSYLKAKRLSLNQKVPGSFEYDVIAALVHTNIVANAIIISDNDSLEISSEINTLLSDLHIPAASHALFKNIIYEIAPLLHPPCTALPALTIHNDSLAEPPNVGVFTNLLYLDLSSNHLESLPGLGSLTKLKTLILHTNDLGELSDVGELTSLESLWLNSNKLSKLPGLKHLTQLKELYLSFNRLSCLPDLSNLPLLQELYVDFNQLTGLPGLDKLKYLRELHANDNQLTQLPDNLSKLTLLLSLYLQHNKLAALPSLLRLIRLKTLWIHKNNLTSLPNFKNKKRLTELDISNNPLAVNQELDLELLPSLQYLYISAEQLFLLPNSHKQAVVHGNLRILIPRPAHPRIPLHIQVHAQQTTDSQDTNTSRKRRRLGAPIAQTANNIH